MMRESPHEAAESSSKGRSSSVSSIGPRWFTYQENVYFNWCYQNMLEILEI